jgi:hypothetical protein
MKTADALGSNLKELVQVSDPKWTHLDFVFGIDADKFVYNRIIRMMKEQKYE